MRLNFLLLLFLLFSLRFSHAQELILEEKGFIDVFYVHGKYNWANIPEKKAITMYFGKSESYDYGLPKETNYAFDNFESLIIKFQAWTIVGELIMQPTLYWSINTQFLRGEKHFVEFHKISKYPDLVKRYNAIKPSSFRAIIGLGLHPQDESKGGGYAWFKINDGDIIFYSSKKSPYTFPTAPVNTGQGMILRTDFPNNSSFGFVTNFDDFKLINDKSNYIKQINGVVKVSGSYIYNEIQKGTFKAARTNNDQNIYLNVTWPLGAIDRIHETYLEYERGDKTPLENLEEKLENDKKSIYKADNTWSEPFEDDLKGVEPFSDYKTRTLQLRKPNRSIVKSFDTELYVNINKFGDKGSHFILSKKSKRESYQDNNSENLIDKRGNILTVDGEKNFSEIVNLTGGRIKFTVQQSNSLYQNEYSFGTDLSTELYPNSSEPISVIESYIQKASEAWKKKHANDPPNQVYYGWSKKYNVIKFKEIITDDQLKVISSEVGYRIR